MTMPFGNRGISLRVVAENLGIGIPLQALRAADFFRLRVQRLRTSDGIRIRRRYQRLRGIGLRNENRGRDSGKKHAAVHKGA